MGEKIINYFYRPIKDLDTNEASFCDVYQILPSGVNISFLYSLKDKETLMNFNEECFIFSAKKRKFLYEFEYIDNLSLSFFPSVAFIEDEDNYRRLLKILNANNLRNGRTILFFDVLDIFDKNKDFKLRKIKNLKSNGIKITLGSFGKSINLMDIFNDFEFDYFRVSASYIMNANSNLILSLNEFCKNANVKLIVEGICSPQDLRKIKQCGVSLVCGDFISSPKESLTREILGLKALSSIEREKYSLKVKSEKVDETQKLLMQEGKRLLRKAKHDAEFDTGDIIIAKPEKKIFIPKPTKIVIDERKKLLKEGKLPEEKRIKLDEEGNRISSEFENSIIETLYSLLADKSVKDKEERILNELEAARLKAKRKAEEEFILSQIALLEKKSKEKKKKLLLRLLPMLNNRIEYLIELDIIRLQLEELDIQEKIKEAKERREEEERQAELKRKQLEEDRIREAIRAYSKEKAFLAEEARKREEEEKKKPKHKFDDSLYVPFDYDEIFVSAEIEEEAVSIVLGEYYVSEDNVEVENKISSNEKAEEKKIEVEEIKEEQEELIKDIKVEESIEEKKEETIQIEEPIKEINSNKEEIEIDKKEFKEEKIKEKEEKLEKDKKVKEEKDKKANEEKLKEDKKVEKEKKGDKKAKEEREHQELIKRVLGGGFDIDLTYSDGGKYNKKKQWVTEDGEMYNGYFDKSGRWIDYGYYDDDDKWSDNGFFDKKLNCFIPYGYFDDDGNYIKI